MNREELITHDIYSPINIDLVDQGVDHYSEIEKVAVTDPCSLKEKRVAILASHGITESELTYPYDFLKARGAKVDILAPWWIIEYQNSLVHLSRYLCPSINVKAECLRRALSEGTIFDALLIPGGAWGTQVLRQDCEALELVRRHDQHEIPIATICSGPHVLINAKLERKIQIASSESIENDLVNAGFTTVESSVHQDQNIISSRHPHDMPELMNHLESKLKS